MGRRRQFFLNTMVMTVGSLILRFTGIGFRAWLFVRLGARGMGEFQLMLTLFMLAVTACTSGLGLAVTRAVAEGVGGRREVRRCCGVSVGLSLAACALLWTLAPALGERVLGGAETILPLRLLGLGLPCMAVSSCLRGYFMAARVPLLPALGDLLEQAATIVGVVVLFSVTQPLVALCLGYTLGELVAACFVVCCYLVVSCRKHLAKKGSATGAMLVHIAAPVMGGNLARSALSSVENLLVPRGLSRSLAGAGRSPVESQSMALAEYGAVSMVLPILFLPLSILQSAAVLLVPELASFRARGHSRSIRRTTDRAIAMTLWFSFPVTAVILFFSGELGQWFCGSTQAGEYIRILAPIIPVLYLDSVVDGMLKGLDQQVYSFRYNCVDGVLRVIMAAVLVPRYGITGYFLLLFFSEIFNCALSLGRLLRVTEVEANPLWWLAAPLMLATTLYLLLHLLRSVLFG